jgi:hypothetical protein
LSLKYSYRGRRGYLAGRYYRGVNRSGGRGGGSKGKKLFYLLLLALFILAALFSPVLKDTFSTRGKESVENIPLLRQIDQLVFYKTGIRHQDKQAPLGIDRHNLQFLKGTLF